MQMTCPKCHGQMRQYERNGVTVDQCAECRGIFLDRGELERLTAAENAWHGSQQHAAPPPPPQQQHGYQDPSYPRHDQHRHDDHGHHKKHKKQESFFEDLFG
ncbi:zf-TFIIB domain-containing protein [Catellatospora sichuanensis]|uniref:TFIIB-type zinc ribbon-containing protein n=1 Tax=Catellatospora sichuanensis TaxID=1969805 RepID=UPI001184351D|nr:zf-TFIIB domain-containing protein [Catellatospora sichuanensis]